MEFMDQGSLKSVIESKKGYSTGRICSWMAMAADGIQFLIERNVHYRNVRPTNMLLNSNYILKLSDFGICKGYYGKIKAINDNTCFYIAPEVLSGEGDVKSAVADVYAIGIIIWELFYRKPPYTEKRTLKLCKNILNGERPFIDLLVPDEMQKLIERCWSHDTGNRPSLLELVDFFKEMRSQEEVREVEEEQRLQGTPREKIKKSERQTEELSETMKPLKVSTDTPEMEDLQDSISSHSLFELIEIKYQTFIFRGNPLLEEIGPNWTGAIDNLEKIPRQVDKGTILFLGGVKDGRGTDEMVILKQDRWIKLALKLRKVLRAGGAVCLNGEIYIFGGYGMEKELYKLDNKTKKWIRLADMNEGRWYISNISVEWNGSIWVFGGYNGSSYLKSVERYDPKENNWIKMPDMTYSRGGAAAAVHNGKFIVCGGRDYPNDLKSVECFDPESGVWTEMNDMPTPLNSHSLVSYGNNLILMGGWDGKTVNNVLELSNLEGKGTWKELPPMKQPRHSFSPAVLDNEIFVIGGYNGTDKSLDKTEIFNGKSWREGPQLPNVCCNMPSIIIPRHLADILSNYRELHNIFRKRITPLLNK